MELSIIRDNWESAHGIPASGTCICVQLHGKLESYL